MTDPMKVVAIEAVKGNGSAFVLAKDQKRFVYTSTSAVIQSALVGAFLTRAEVQLDVIGQAWIKRVNAFGPGSGPLMSPGPFRVSRMATQRTEGVDHLEVFLVRPPDKNETAYNVFDPLLQQLFLAAFLPLVPTGIGLDFDYTGNEAIYVRVGELA